MSESEITYAPLDYIALNEQTYRVLKDKILRRELKPGEQISVPKVAAALHVSRMPVNDALKRLAGDGLVEIIPRRGTFVTGLTARDASEIFDVRLMIELYAAETVLQAGKVEQFLASVRAPLAAMEQAVAGDTFRNYELFMANDRDFHLALVKLTDNHHLMGIYSRLNVHTHGARAHYLDGDNARQAQAEHKAIIQAFENGAADQVEAALHVHITGVKDRLLNLLEQRGGKL
jgi:DNA-binding GntR family transcriptional regulator